MTAITETDVVLACQTLFGKHVDISRDFLYYVQPGGVKSAYRKKAKETHPDLFAAEPPHIQKKQTALFREILQAYDVLTLFLKQREDGAWRPPRVRTVRPRRKKEEQRKTQPASERPQPGKNDDTYYHGGIPFCTLQIGQYLFYRGKISFGTLVKALIWQRKQRPSFGDIALRWGLLDPEDIAKISAASNLARLFGERAVMLGLLTIFQVNTVLLFQRSLQNRLGRYFVMNSIFTHEELERMDRQLKEHNAGVLAASLHYKRQQQACA